MAHDYANLSKWLNDNLVPEHAAKFWAAETQCFDSNAVYSYKDLNPWFKRGWSSLKDDVPASVREWSGTMGKRATPKTPWYLFEVENADKLVQKWY